MNLIYAIVFLPLISFFYCIFFGRIFNKNTSFYLSSFLLIVSAFFSWIVLFNALDNYEIQKYYLFEWITSENFNSNWSFRVDTLTIVMMFLISNVSACVHVYSIEYMSNDKSSSRFMAYLSLFTFFMLFLVTSDNLLQLFFGWEGVGLTSYLLIGFWNYKESANKAAIKAFIVNRIGDFAFLIGIVGVFYLFNSIYFDDIFDINSNITKYNINFFGINLSSIDFICLLLFIGAMGKSAQLGLHTWLPDAMEGPTPVSALIHAATMVTAGVFLVVRMSPIFEYANFTNMFITLIGSSTAIFAASIAITQNDIKRVIAYSTCSQLGYMFCAAGLGAYNIAIFHLITHGFFKALLFLCAGSVIHSLNNQQDMRKMGGIAKKIPITTSLMWIGSMAIIGFPFFSGYYSKESILEIAYYNNSSLGFFSYYIGIITAFLTAFYSWRLLLMTFHGKTNLSNEQFKLVHESPLIMILPLIFLAAGSIFCGFLLYDYFVGYKNILFWNESISLSDEKVQHLPTFQNLFVKTFVSLGIIIATFFYFYNKNLPNLFSKNFSIFYKILYNKWYIDDIYSYIFIKPTFYISNILFIKGDQKTIDTIGPNGISKMIKIFSKFLSYFQSGFIYHYAFSMFIGLILILSWFMFF